MEINQILEEMGLSKKETEVYFALLKLGEDTASRISEIANLNRVTTYMVLKSLQEKGFCAIYEKNKIQYFKPIKPENILGIIDERRERFKKILPELKSKEKQVHEKPEVELFQGEKGIISMLKLMLDYAEGTKIVYAYGNLSVAEKVIEFQTAWWRNRRIQDNIRMNAVVDSLKGFEAKEQEKWKKLSTWKINKDLSNLGVFVMVSGTIVSYTTFKGELISVVINNKEISEKEKFNFDMLWKSV